MSQFENIEHLLQKVEWEGGWEGAFDYGIKTEDLPDDVPLAIKEAFYDTESAYKTYMLKLDELLGVLESAGYEVWI